MAYDQWLESPQYRKVSSELTYAQDRRNREVIGNLDVLRRIKEKPRSR